MVKVETRGGSLSFNSISGSIVGVTAAGDVKLDDLSGPVKMSSGGGVMEAGSVGSDLYLQSGWRHVSVERVNGQFIVKTGGGKVHIGTSGGTSIETGAGNIEINKCNGDLRANSGGGNLNLGDVYGTVTGGNRRRKRSAGQRSGCGASHYGRRDGGVVQSRAERAGGDRGRGNHRAVCRWTR